MSIQDRERNKRIGEAIRLLSPKETAAVEMRFTTYELDFDRTNWFIRRNPGVVAGGFATKEEAAQWLKEFEIELRAIAEELRKQGK